jgi:hypothetical protein
MPRQEDVQSMRMTRLIRSLFFAFVLLAAAVPSFAQVAVSVTIAPPEIPVYEQPVCPGDGYLWTPGYWAWDADDADYYWVPGTWILAPEVGFFWTPGWWGWGGSAFLWHGGYWGPVVGFYGGINYGFGYFGHGFDGGRWDNGHFFYNRAVLNVNVNIIHNVYENRVDIHNDVRVSYNGGHGGIDARPSAQEEAAEHDRHIGPVAAQTQHIQAARANRDLRASVNHGKPSVAATGRPGDFKAGVPAKEGSYKEEPHGGSNSARTGTSAGKPNAVHPNELPPAERPAAPNTGNPKTDQKYQQQQDQLMAKQNQERQKLQAQQEKEHQQLAKQNANEQAKAQVEQKHQQQTQQMVQRHTQQQQQLQQRQAPASHSAPRK